MNVRILACTAGLLALATALSTPAADLTYAELESCMRAKTAALALTRKVDDERAALDAGKQALAADEEALAQARGRLDRHDGAAVAAFNERIERQDAAGRAFNERVSAFNTAAAEATGLAHDYAERCAERTFKAEDVERLPAELRGVARDGGVMDVDDYARARARASAPR